MIIGFEQLDKLQKDYICRYATGAYRAINLYLRTEPELDMFNIMGMVKVIDPIFGKTPAGELNPPIVYRGTQNDTMYNAPEFIDKGYMSTSLDENIAVRKFIASGKDILLKIHLHCSVINLLQVDGDIKEHEYLFPRNTKFRVLYRGGEIKTEKNQVVPCIGICPI